ARPGRMPASPQGDNDVSNYPDQKPQVSALPTSQAHHDRALMLTGFVDMRPVMTSKYASALGRDALSACAKPRTAEHVVVHPRNAGCGGTEGNPPRIP